MAKDPFEQFQIPNEMRAFAEQSVAQARKAFDGFIQAANQAMGQLHGHAHAAQSGATEIAHKIDDLCRAERENDLRFRPEAFAGEGRQRGHGAAVGILSRQMQAISSQVQDLGQSAAKIVVDAAKNKT